MRLVLSSDTFKASLLADKDYGNLLFLFPKFFKTNIFFFSFKTDKTDPDKTCRPNGTAEGVSICSGRGKCDCGSCLCDPQREGVILTGQFCETVSIKFSVAISAH
jgi:hypothetical protein